MATGSLNISSQMGRGAMRRLLKISIVPGDFPREQNVFHACAGANVVHNQISLFGLVPDVDDHTYVFGASQTQIPRNDIAGQERFAAASGRQ